MRPALVVVRGGRSIPSLVSPEDEAELVRGRTRIFRFTPELAPVDEIPDVAPIATLDCDESIILDARRELAARRQQHPKARELKRMAESAARSPRAWVTTILAAFDCIVTDALEASRLTYERAEWMRENGARS